MFLACRDSRLFRIAPESDTPAMLATVGVTPIAIAYGDGALWWINFSEAGGVTKIDPANGSTAFLSAPYAKFVVPADQRVWFIDANGNAFWMDPGGSRPSRSVKKARVALGVSFDRETVFINDGDLVGFDGGDGEVTQRARGAGRQNDQAVAGIAVLGPNIWLVDPKGQRIVAVPR